MKNLEIDKNSEWDHPLDVQYFEDYELDGIDHGDYPKYCDTYISGATAVLNNGSSRDATDEELDRLNDDGDLVYSLLQNYLY